MDLLVKLSSAETFDNPLSILLDIVNMELASFKLAMLSSQKLDEGFYQVTGFCSEDYCPIYTAEEMLNTSSNFPIFEGDFIESWKIHNLPQKISCITCPGLFQGDLKYFGEAIVVPIWINGKVNRWIVLVDYPAQSQNLDLIKLSLLLNYALTNILRTEQKRQLDKARLWIDEELHEISRIQALLLPQGGLTIEGVQIAFKFKAFKDAGGDYLDLFQIKLPTDKESNNKSIRWGGVIADVTGHGPSAAVEAAMLDAILRTYPGNEQTTPATVANYVNTNFFTRQDRGKFITAKFFSYNGDTKTLRYVSAGHPNGFIKRGKEVIQLDKSLGIPIGILPDYQWEYKEFIMEVGDILFIYTDVVLETRNIENEEFGFDRLIDVIAEAPNCPHQLVDLVEQALLGFSNTKVLMDDLTLSAILLE
ncbi:MAG: sigma-B regulation protein RsbU (phosphoserine phosphatase) [Enterobacterales bacterium]|jgi:sigma-B regulation protein RsbU (phosphoserine phosphatase)